jgi:hypothetical protein
MTLDNIPEAENFLQLIDLEEEMDAIEDEVRLAARLMVAFIDPAGRDEDDLCETCQELAAVLEADQHDVQKIHNLLILALAQCQAEGCLTGALDDVPYHWHLGFLMIEAIQAGARLPEIEASYEAKLPNGNFAQVGS